MKKSHVIAVILCLLVAVSVSAFAQAAPKDPIILKGSPMGGVKFAHSTHKQACTTCHHASKPEKPAKTASEACADCHTKQATAPMKTNFMNAFHKAGAKAGICIDCHTKEAAAGKKAPTKCAECHQKSNV